MNRRDFLKSKAAASLFGGTAVKAANRLAATDWVELGTSAVKVTRLAFGTGSHGGRIQQELGQEKFTALVRHAYDGGIRFFETAESYTGMPQMLATALQGIPRDSYKLMTKALQYVFQWGTVNAVTIGHKSPAEIDEAIQNIGLALNA